MGYIEESELLAFAIYAVANNRKKDIKEFNEWQGRYRIYYGDVHDEKDELCYIAIKLLDDDEVTENDVFYIYRDKETGYNYTVRQIFDVDVYPEFRKGSFKIVPSVVDFTRSKITAILELQDWVYY